MSHRVTRAVPAPALGSGRKINPGHARLVLGARRRGPAAPALDRLQVMPAPITAARARPASRREWIARGPCTDGRARGSGHPGATGTAGPRARPPRGGHRKAQLPAQTGAPPAARSRARAGWTSAGGAAPPPRSAQSPPGPPPRGAQSPPGRPRGDTRGGRARSAGARPREAPTPCGAGSTREPIASGYYFFIKMKIFVPL